MAVDNLAEIAARKRTHAEVFAGRTTRLHETRKLIVSTEAGAYAEIELHEAEAAHLIRDGLIYGCEMGGHDLHLNPNHDFTIEDVERIVTLAAGER